MLKQNSEIPELFYLKSKWDDNPNKHYPWEDNILKKTVSPNTFNNGNMKDYLLQLEDLVSLMLESVNIVRNYLNIAVDKYYNDYWN